MLRRRARPGTPVASAVDAGPNARFSMMLAERARFPSADESAPVSFGDGRVRTLPGHPLREGELGWRPSGGPACRSCATGRASASPERGDERAAQANGLRTSFAHRDRVPTRATPALRLLRRTSSTRRTGEPRGTLPGPGRAVHGITNQGLIPRRAGGPPRSRDLGARQEDVFRRLE